MTVFICYSKFVSTIWFTICFVSVADIQERLFVEEYIKNKVINYIIFKYLLLKNSNKNKKTKDKEKLDLIDYI